jgi:hypothetical protein
MSFNISLTIDLGDIRFLRCGQGYGHGHGHGIITHGDQAAYDHLNQSLHLQKLDHSENQAMDWSHTHIDLYLDSSLATYSF